MDRATDLGLTALAASVDKEPVAFYQGIDLIGCRYTAEDKKLCQLTNAQLVGAIRVTPAQMAAYSREHSDFAGAYARDLAALDSEEFSRDVAKSAFSAALEVLKTADAQPQDALDLAGEPDKVSALDRLPNCMAYCPALRELNLRHTQVSDLAPLARLIANGLEIIGFDPAL